MKELVLKKMTELEEIYRSVHMDIDGGSERRILNDLIDSGSRPSCAFILKHSLLNLIYPSFLYCAFVSFRFFLDAPVSA